MVQILNEQQLRELVPADRLAYDIVERSFEWMGHGLVDMPSIMHISVPSEGGDFDIKSAYVDGLENLTVKVGSGFFRNAAKGLPSSSSIMVVMNTQTGFCEAVLIENGYLTDLRTGMAGAVAAKWIAPPVVEHVGVIGAGAQARFQIECLQQTRNFQTVHVYSHNQSSAEKYATEMRGKLGVEVVVAASAEHVVRSSQLVVTTTPASEPVIRAEWLHPGLHITAMGSDTPGKHELEVECLYRASAIFCDSKNQCVEKGELQHCPPDRLPSLAQNIAELGHVVAGTKPFERKAEDITICDLTGMGVQDTAIGNLAMQRYKAHSLA